MYFVHILLLILLIPTNADNHENQVSVVNRVSEIAEKYSNWALGKRNMSPMHSPYQVTQNPAPPRYYNTAPVKQFFHNVRIQPPVAPKPIIVHHPTPSFYPIPRFPVVSTTTPYPFYSNSTITPLYYQQVPAPSTIEKLPFENRQLMHSPMKTQHHPNFPRLLESEVSAAQLQSPFPSNSSVLPNHMAYNMGPSILSQLLGPISLESSSTPPQVYINPSPSEPTKEQVLKIASQKRFFGMIPRFPIGPPARGFYQTSECLNGWCGGECCEPPRQFSPVPTTIQATAVPGSPGPSHPLVLVVHPSPPLQCSPACQPNCNPQCVARLQYMGGESHFYNSIIEPTCRPDCMPSCHVDCLIIPPQQTRCNSFHCQCLAGYVPCAAFTCCMRYPNMAAKMKSNILAKSSEEIPMIEGDSEPNAERRRMYTPIRKHGRNREVALSNLKLSDIEVVTTPPIFKSRKWTKNRVESTTSTSTTTTTTTPVPCNKVETTVLPITPTIKTSTSTTTTTSPPPPTTTTTITTTTTTTTPSTTTPTTTLIPPATTAQKNLVLNLTPIYPDMIKDRKVPLIPAYGLWTIPGSTEGNETGEKRVFKNSVGDLRGRHVIRSENFLDVLSELAQVKLKEDIMSDEFSQAANLLDFMTDQMRKL